MKKKAYIKPHIDVIPLPVQRNLLLVVSGNTNTDVQMSPAASPGDDFFFDGIFF